MLSRQTNQEAEYLLIEKGYLIEKKKKRKKKR